MAISDATRKLLWARSGDRCAKCKCPLTEDGLAPAPPIVVGQECHIVSGKMGGPRFRPLEPATVDSYENLILLCPSDHTIVDKQPDRYPEDVLKNLKTKHEEWVRTMPSPSHLPVRIERESGVTTLHLIESGRDLMAFAGGAHSCELVTPEFVDVGEADIVGGFVQLVHDWAEIWPEIPVSDRLRTEVDLTNELADLRAHGFIAYATRRTDKLAGGLHDPAAWEAFVLAIYRVDDPIVLATQERQRAATENLTEDEEYWRGQIIALGYALIADGEGCADFEVDSLGFRPNVAAYARRMRGIVKGKFRSLAGELPSDSQEERILTEGNRRELLALLRTYTTLFD
jgi:hypothetical protein